MTRTLLVAGNAFRAVMSQRALYIWAFALVLMFLRAGPVLFRQNRPPEMMAFLRANTASGTLDLWAYLCLATAIYLGGMSVASDLRSKTILPVMARPLQRWQLLLGKWIGVVAFCLVTLSIGVAVVTAVAVAFGIDLDRAALTMAVTRTAAGVVLLSGIGVAISPMGSAPIACAIALTVAILPQLIDPLRDDPEPVYHNAGLALDALVPPAYRSHYLGVAWVPLPVPPQFQGVASRLRPPVVDYDRSRKESAETLGYAFVYVILGCAWFARRDLRFS